MRKLAWFSAAFSLAVFLAVYLLPEEILVPAGAVCALAALTGLLLRGKARLRMLLVCFGLAAGLCWTGAYSGIVRAPALQLADTETQVEAVVADWPQENHYSTSVLAEIWTEKGGTVKTLLYLSGEGADDLRPGDRLTITVSFRMADTMAGEETDYYYAKGILLIGSCEEWTVERSERVPVKYWPAIVSRALKKSVARAFPDSAVPLVTALITGDSAAGCGIQCPPSVGPGPCDCRLRPSCLLPGGTDYHAAGPPETAVGGGGHLPALLFRCRGG